MSLPSQPTDPAYRQEDHSSMLLPAGDLEMPSGPGSPYEPESYNYTLQYPLSSAAFVEGDGAAYTHATSTCNRKQCQNTEFQCRVYAYQVKDLRQQRAALERQLLETKTELLVLQRQRGAPASTSEISAPAPAPVPALAPVPAPAPVRAPVSVPARVLAPNPVVPDLPSVQEGETFTEEQFTLEQRMTIFWEEDHWIAYRRKWKKRSAHPQGDKLGFLVDIRGEKISIGRLRMIAAYQTDVFHEIARRLGTNAPETWVKEATDETKNFHRRRMAEKFEEFRLCENNWKADRFAKLKYGEWVRGPGHLPFPKNVRQRPSRALKSKNRSRALPKKRSTVSSRQPVRTSRPSAPARSPNPNARSQNPRASQTQEDDQSDSDNNGWITGTMSPLTEDPSPEDQDELESVPDITEIENEIIQFSGSSNQDESMLPPDDDDQEPQSPQLEDRNQDSVHPALDQSGEDASESVSTRLRSAKQKAPANIHIASSPFKPPAAGAPSKSRALKNTIIEGSNNQVFSRAMRARDSQREIRKSTVEEDIHDHSSSSREDLPSEWGRSRTRSEYLAQKKRIGASDSAYDARFAKDLSSNNTDTAERAIDPRTRFALKQLKRGRSPEEDSEDEDEEERARSKRNTRNAVTRSMAPTERKK